MTTLLDTASLTSLRDRWTQFQQDHPKVRIRDAAQRLGVSEAELLATGCGGEEVVRLRGGADLPELVKEFPRLGTVMALSRNDAVVHEKHGRYENVEVFPEHKMGQVLGKAIDLRLFFRFWHHGFAVTEPARDGETRRSLHFFDAAGTAVHKVYLQPESDHGVFAELVERFRSDDQSATQTAEPAAPEKPEKSDSEVDVAALHSGWRAMQNTHDFFGLTRRCGVTRTQALRLAEPEFVRPVAVNSFRLALEKAAATDFPIMVFVGNPGIYQIHTGPVHRLVEHGEWFNVLDPDFNLHLRPAGIARAWVVRKPTADGIVTSVEFYDEAGHDVALLFGERKPGQVELSAWRELTDSLTE